MFLRRFSSSLTRKAYNQLSSKDVTYFSSLLSSDDLWHETTGKSADDLLPFNTDWMRKYIGHSRLVLTPRSTKQVSNILMYCNDQNLAVVPQGGNTGLVGGAVPVNDEIIINMRNMNKIINFDNSSGILQCQAGCILESIDNYLRDNQYMMPLDLGAKGSCQIGGNVATNAGGLRLLRYGSLHGTVLGLEVVLPDGRILSDLKSLRKDNTGYDLKQLFIGSEGTLGIITSVSILCPPKPNAVNVALLSLDSYDHVLETFSESKRYLGEILSAFEFFDQESLRLVMKHSPVKFPLETDKQFYVLIETSGSNKDHDDQKLEMFLEDVLSKQLITNGTVAQDFTQLKSIWAFRESIPEACSKAGAVYKYDLSIPLPKLYHLVEDVRRRVAEKGLLNEDKVRTIIGYGHVGDGNLHLNISASSYSKEISETLEPFVYEWVSKQNGSISAEHGLGFMKKNHIGYSKSSLSIEIMKKLKNYFDPNHILNPYKFLPE